MVSLTLFPIFKAPKVKKIRGLNLKNSVSIVYEIHVEF